MVETLNSSKKLKRKEFKYDVNNNKSYVIQVNINDGWRILAATTIVFETRFSMFTFKIILTVFIILSSLYSY